jgi:hypothetical protein
MRAPDVRGALQSARATSAVVASVAAPMRGGVRFIAPLTRRTAIWWWEFESEVKRRLALELLMRRMFAIVPSSGALSA